jgi:hypothetical protein
MELGKIVAIQQVVLQEQVVKLLLTQHLYQMVFML